MKKAETAFVSKKDCIKKLEKLSSHSSLKPQDDMGVYFLKTERVFVTTNYATMIYCDVSLFSPGKDVPEGSYSFLPDGKHVKIGEIPEGKTRRWGEYLEKGVLDRGTHEAYGNILISKATIEKGINIQELVINFRHNFFQLVDLLRCADTGNNILALRVHQELAHELLLAGSGITRKSDACSGGLAHIAERHHLHIDRGTP